MEEAAITLSQFVDRASRASDGKAAWIAMLGAGRAA
jgi:hypothetical protein